VTVTLIIHDGDMENLPSVTSVGTMNYTEKKNGDKKWHNT
jgi:hypothetical protein